MAYDVNAMTSHFRILIRDPNGDALDATQIRDEYLNPAYQDWWRRYEHRRSFFSVQMSPGDRTTLLGGTPALYNSEVREVNIIDPVGGTITFGVKRSEYNRVRWLQETEAAIGLPRQWAWDNISYATGGPGIAWYPLPDQVYDFFIRYHAAPAALTLGTSLVLTDPVSARYITRLAAYRAALDLELPPRIAATIAAPIPTWVKVLFNIRYAIEGKVHDKQEALGYSRVEPAGI